MHRPACLTKSRQGPLQVQCAHSSMRPEPQRAAVVWFRRDLRTGRLPVWPCYMHRVLSRMQQPVEPYGSRCFTLYKPHSATWRELTGRVCCTQWTMRGSLLHPAHSTAMYCQCIAWTPWCCTPALLALSLAWKCHTWGRIDCGGSWPIAHQLHTPLGIVRSRLQLQVAPLQGSFQHAALHPHVGGSTESMPQTMLHQRVTRSTMQHCVGRLHSRLLIMGCTRRCWQVPMPSPCAPPSAAAAAVWVWVGLHVGGASTAAACIGDAAGGAGAAGKELLVAYHWRVGEQCMHAGIAIPCCAHVYSDPESTFAHACVVVFS